MPRAGRPVKMLVSVVLLSLACFSAARCSAEVLASGVEHEGGADLHAGRAQRQRRHDAAPVADAAGGDHRHLHRIDDLRHQRHRAGLPRDVVVQEHAAMAAGLVALGDHDVAAVPLQPARLLRRGGGADHQHAGILHAA